MFKALNQLCHIVQWERLLYVTKYVLELGNHLLSV